MSKLHGFHTLRRQVPFHSYIPSNKVLGAGALLVLGAGLIFALPDSSDDAPITSAAADVPQTTAAQTPLDESLCDKQAWPYIDQRCAQRVEAARGTRKVRIVTDKGTSVNVVTPVPIVEPKPAPAPKPVVAQADRPIGPAAIPTVEQSAPAAQNVAAAPQQPARPATVQTAPASQQPAAAPQVTATVAPAPAPAPAPTVQAAVAPVNPPAATPAATNAMASAAVPPAAASTAPMAPGVDALDQTSEKKSKSARAERAEKRAAERAERREARRRKAIEQETASGGVPEEVVATVKRLPSGDSASRNSKRARNGGVPDEVIAAVEEAAARERGDRGGRRVIVERGGQTVTVGSPNGGQRMYLVPREQGSW